MATQVQGIAVGGRYALSVGGSITSLLVMTHCRRRGGTWTVREEGKGDGGGREKRGEEGRGGRMRKSERWEWAHFPGTSREPFKVFSRFINDLLLS